MISMAAPMVALRTGVSHRFTSLWAITLKDSTVLRYTDAPQPIEYEGNTYSPMTVTEASAVESPQGLGERNQAFLGYLSSGQIEEDDLRAGKFDDAQVVETQIDRRYPWQGKFTTNTFFITEMSWSGERWEAQLDGLTTKLRQLKGTTTTFRCQWELGDGDCTVDLGPHTDSGTVTAVDTQRRTVQTNLTGEVLGYYDLGQLTFTSGANNGDGYKVLSYNPTNGVMTLLLPTTFDIAVSDTFDVYPGCNHTPPHCKGTDGRPWSNNFANYGGDPHVPGTTETLTTPDQK